MAAGSDRSLNARPLYRFPSSRKPRSENCRHPGADARPTAAMPQAGERRWRRSRRRGNANKVATYRSRGASARPVRPRRCSRNFSLRARLKVRNGMFCAALCSKFTRFGAQFIGIGPIPEVTYATGIRIMFISWLTADFSIMGVHIQYWIPTFILVFVVFYIFSELNLRRIGK